MSLTDEMLMTAKLKSLGVKCDPFAGLTTFQERRENVRALIGDLADVTYTVRDGKRITLAQQFETVYGCPLVTA